MTSVAVILSGCGHFDGAEIRESVLTLLALDEAEAEVEIFAPDIEQRQVVNHRTGERMDEVRNVLVEAARIARGHIAPLSVLDVAKFDALIFPGGFGVATNFSDIATHGAYCAVDPLLKRIIYEAVIAKKPIGAICIAPALIVAVLRDYFPVTVTIGDDPEGLIPQLGGIHKVAATTDIVVDEEHAIVTTSAYMRNDRLSDIAIGIRKCVTHILSLCSSVG
jgi:enhancing lycopene biosynthesis protein 2